MHCDLTFDLMLPITNNIWNDISLITCGMLNQINYNVNSIITFQFFAYRSHACIFVPMLMIEVARNVSKFPKRVCLETSAPKNGNVSGNVS